MCRYAVVTLTAMALLTAGLAVAGGSPIELPGLAIEGWKASDGPRTWVGDAVEEKIDGFVVFHQGFNLIDTQWLLFQKDEAKLDVFVFTYDTPDNAYGLYTVMRRTIMQAGGAEPVEVGNEASYHPMGQLLAWAGRCCIVVTTATPEPPDKQAFVTVAEKLAAQLPGESSRPELVKALPAEDLDDASIIYCHYRQALDQVFYVGEENVLRMGDDVTVPTPVEAVYAKYEIGGHPHEIVLLRYPEAAEARQAAEAFGTTQADGAKSDRSEGDWRDIELRNGKHTLIYQSENLLAFSAEVASGDSVKALIEAAAAKLAAPPAAMMMGGG